MFYDPRTEAHGLPHDPWLALIVPRPVGWISTVSPEGVPNLAPYSSFNTLSSNPPFLMFSSDEAKDSITNAEATGYFCVNIATFGLRNAMNRSAARYPADQDEFAITGLGSAPCRNISCVYVAESPVSIECRLSQVITLAPSTGAVCTNRVAIGEVVGIRIDESVMRDGMVDIDLLKPLGRLGYREYTVPPRSFEMIRPAWDENQTAESSVQ